LGYTEMNFDRQKKIKDNIYEFSMRFGEGNEGKE
jgi:hypothetical protein